MLSCVLIHKKKSCVTMICRARSIEGGVASDRRAVWLTCHQVEKNEEVGMFLEVRELFCTICLEIPVFEIGKEGPKTIVPSSSGHGSNLCAITALPTIVVQDPSIALFLSTVAKTASY